jgi:hypothetical protein
MLAYANLLYYIVYAKYKQRIEKKKATRQKYLAAFI